MIQRQVERLKLSGFNEIIIIAGSHNLKKLKKLFPEDIKIIEQEDLSQGMAGAVLSAAPLLGDEPVLVVSSNDILDKEAYSLMAKATEDSSLAGALLGYRVDKYFPGGYLCLSENGNIKSIIEKPTPGEEPGNLINLVVHFHRSSKILIEYIQKSENKCDDRYEQALDAIFKSGSAYRALEYQGNWQSIKYPWHIHGAWKYFFQEEEKFISKTAQIHETAIIQGAVIIEDDVKVFPHAVISGPAYIGKGCIVANNALVRDSHLGPQCVAGYNTEIARSYLSGEVWTHSNYIGDSIIGYNVSFGAGSITANLRLDEEEISMNIGDGKILTGSNKCGTVCADHVRVGVSTNLMPGIKIGNNSLIGSGLVISEDVPAHSYVTGSHQLSIRPNRMTVDNLSRESLMQKLKQKP